MPNWQEGSVIDFLYNDASLMQWTKELWVTETTVHYMLQYFCAKPMLAFFAKKLSYHSESISDMFLTSFLITLSIQITVEEKKLGPRQFCLEFGILTDINQEKQV